MPSRPWDGEHMAPLKRRFFSAKDSPCPAQIVATAVHASSNSARRISICALRSSLSIRWPGEVLFGPSLGK